MHMILFRYMAAARPRTIGKPGRLWAVNGGRMQGGDFGAAACGGL